MRFAVDFETLGKREPTIKGDRAKCPACDSVVIGKCGELIVHHWAHASKLDCDPWSEGETQWHRDWKSCLPPENQEVVIGPHRADIVLADKTVVELQHSAISPEVIREREQFYGNMIWLFDGRTIPCSMPDDRRRCYCRWESNDYGTSKTHTCERCRESLQISNSQFGVKINWKRLRKTWFSANAAMFIELGQDRILQITKIFSGNPRFGRLGTCQQFREWLSASGKNRLVPFPEFNLSTSRKPPEQDKLSGAILNLLGHD